MHSGDALIVLIAPETSQDPDAWGSWLIKSVFPHFSHTGRTI